MITNQIVPARGEKGTKARRQTQGEVLHLCMAGGLKLIALFRQIRGLQLESQTWWRQVFVGYKRDVIGFWRHNSKEFRDEDRLICGYDQIEAFLEPQLMTVI